jgi:hypothetical protein
VKSTKDNGTNRPDPYQIDKLSKVPAGIKIGLLQFWLAGAAFMLTVLGLSAAFDWLDRLVMLTLILTLATEYGSNAIISWMRTDKIDTGKYLPHEFPRKSVTSLLFTGLYVLVIVVSFHFLLEAWVMLGLPSIGDVISESTADPISFGIWFLVVNFVWLRVRTLLKKPIGRR